MAMSMVTTKSEALTRFRADFGPHSTIPVSLSCTVTLRPAGWFWMTTFPFDPISSVKSIVLEETLLSLKAALTSRTSPSTVMPSGMVSGITFSLSVAFMLSKSNLPKSATWAAKLSTAVGDPQNSI